jgi:hypothetical protein
MYEIDILSICPDNQIYPRVAQSLSPFEMSFRETSLEVLQKFPKLKIRGTLLIWETSTEVSQIVKLLEKFLILETFQDSGIRIFTLMD